MKKELQGLVLSAPAPAFFFMNVHGILEAASLGRTCNHLDSLWVPGEELWEQE